MIKSLIKKYFPQIFFHIKKLYYVLRACAYVKKSYAQEGEDLVLAKLMNSNQKGFYVDIGAHHPRKFSNTHYFYTRGRNGINIDATPGSMKNFNKNRKRDINIEIPIAATRKILPYYIFEEGAYNTFSTKLANRNKNITPLVSEFSLTTKRLSEILSQHIPSGQEIDFFSIDVEGFDLEVLESNDWDKHKPRFILIEEHHFDLENLSASSVYSFLKERGYFIRAKTDNTLFFELQ